ncbi:MAG: carboxypeptidase regulatory-like domain-containing protein, partial [Myxococcota bacterium]
TPRRGGARVINIAGTYFIADDFFQDGGENERIRQLLHVTWSPIEWLEVSLGQATVSNRNTAADVPTTQSLGDPRIAAKVSEFLTPEIGVGGSVAVLLPTSSGGTGLDPSAFVLDAQLLGSYFVAPILQVSANVGYRLDNSSEIFRRPEEALTPAQRFTASVAKVDSLTYGLGAEAQLALGEKALLDPFLEFTGATPLSAADTTEAPLLATLGVKLLPFGKGATEFLLGGDFRLSGAPDPVANDLPGLPPWEVFSRVTFHLSSPEPEPVAAPVEPTNSVAQLSCQESSECPEGLSCESNQCVKVVTETEVVEKAPETFAVTGAVFDQSSGEPLGNAIVKISDFQGTLIAVDYKSGAFQSMPLRVGEGLVQLEVEAPGYRAATQQIQRGTAGAEIPLKFELQSLGEDAVGEVKGSLKDARSGKTIRGQVFIPALNRKIRVDRSGSFSAKVKAGRYQVLIQSRGYITQKKELEIRSGDTVILNVDMSRNR